MRSIEYDHFGPWILEISDTDPVPGVFEPYIIQEDEPLLSLKIPRHEERRNLQPTDHLYDYLLSLYEDRMVILARDGNEAVRFSLAYAEIEAITHSEDLLNGHLIIYTPEIAYDLPYSTVSVDLVEKALDIIRTRYVADISFPTPELDILTEDGIPEGLSYYFTALIRTGYGLGSDAGLFALQRDIWMSELDTRVRRRMFYKAVGMKLLESLHYLSGRELMVINRGRNWVYRWQAVYGRQTLYVPLDRLLAAEEKDVPRIRDNGVAGLQIRTKSSEHLFCFSEDNPALSRYRELAGR